MTLEDIPESFIQREAMKAGGDFGGGDDVLLPGGSGIIGPDGQWVSGPVAGKEAIVYGEIDLDRVAEEQLAFDATGHYNRPDIFQLTVDVREKSPARWIRDEPSSTGGSNSITEVEL